MPAQSYLPGEAYNYPLIIKKLLNTPMIYAPDQMIVYRDRMQYAYRDFYIRIHRLANALAGLGIGTGDTVAVLEYDSHRYLELFFAVPMMGAVLHTLGLCTAPGSYETIGRFRSDDVYMPLTPMFHVHAWGIPFVASLLGVKQVYPGKYEPEMLLKLIVGHKVTFSHCVPTILQMLVTSPAVRQFDLSNWKVIIGGSQLPKGLAKAAQEIGITVYTGYGMSETCPVMSLALPKQHMLDWDAERRLDVITKTGLPIPLVEIEVVDDQDRPLAHDGSAAGEVVLRASWLTRGYYKAEEKTRELWRNGYLHSGDVGNIDPEGYLQITDRTKDVIKSGGEWISSLDLENILSQYPSVLESAAIGTPDERWGERPLMLVVLKPDFQETVSADGLKAHMQQAAEEGRLPRYGVPDRYQFLDALPKTSVGKLDKKVMRQHYA